MSFVLPELIPTLRGTVALWLHVSSEVCFDQCPQSSFTWALSECSHFSRSYGVLIWETLVPTWCEPLWDLCRPLWLCCRWTLVATGPLSVSQALCGLLGPKGEEKLLAGHLAGPLGAREEADLSPVLGAVVIGLFLSSKGRAYLALFLLLHFLCVPPEAKRTAKNVTWYLLLCA